ncbi:hypothetical protein AQUCO_01400102v1 [Aquilegia coerulea]|uniref:Extradiol ring-cleavage dioxygenase class III enzyme subunit B domain-containing protein n=1 Tax=Aquilegia coerulea TaxID=218851 RepID=A0A2G5DUL9_AQUCA|nr:hypothetical protein AQUCO_01400102v1 [Aquilegia coerulea]
MDTFFISHGAPTLCIDEKLPARHFLQSFEGKGFLHEKPKSILVISGHWETSEPTVNVITGLNDTIHDFYGFPKIMYKLQYPAPGAPELAMRTKELLMESGFKCVKEDKARGLDHGAWVPLMLMYPQANIPVCQLSVQTDKDGTYHYNMGNATHNLREIDMNDGPAFPWAVAFDTWLKESLLNGRYVITVIHNNITLHIDFTSMCINCEIQFFHSYEDVNHYEKKAPYAKKTHPWPDHFYPLHVALGAAGEKPKAEQIHQSWSYGSISYASYRFSTN